MSTLNPLIFLLIIILVISLRLLYLLDLVKTGKSCKHVRHKNHIKTCIVMGSGGHTAEMIRMLQDLPNRFQPRQFIVADSDKISVDKVEALEKRSTHGPWNLIKIPRSRQVKQSYFTSIFTTLYATLYSVVVILKDPPEVVLCNGPGTCVPIVASVWLWRLFGKVIPVIYVESFARVESLSLTGKILYPIADRFVVQWDQLLERYPRAVCHGRLV